MNWLRPNAIPRGRVAPGSACLLAIVPIEHVASFPPLNPATQMLDGDITLHPGRAWFRCLLISSRTPLSEELQRSEAGIYWQQNISGRTAGHSIPIHLYTSNLPHHRYLVLYKEAGTAITYIIGMPTSGAIMGVSYSNENGTINTITLSRSSLTRALVYRGTYTLDNNVTIDSGAAFGVANYIATGTEGISFTPTTNLRGRTILWISRAGTLDMAPVPGTPQSQYEFSYNLTTNTITVFADNPLQPSETFFILYR